MQKIYSLQSLKAIVFIGIFLAYAGAIFCHSELGVSIFM